MKKLYYLMSLVAIVAISSALILTGCKKEKEDILDLDMANITQMTESQRAIFDEAVKRIDPFVTFTDGQFVMSINDGEKVGVSERLFTFLSSSIAKRNEFLSGCYLQGLQPIETKRNTIQLIDKNSDFDFIITKSTKKIESGGVDRLEIGFIYVDYYISNTSLVLLSAGSFSVAAYAGYSASTVAAAPYAAVVALGATLSGITSATMSSLYPDGVIIRGGNDYTNIGGWTWPVRPQ